jgi:ribose-phosphate pyrophosphokinase
MILLNGKEVEFKTFPNGETLFTKDGLKTQPYNCISFKYENDGDLIKLMLLKSYVDQYSIRNNLTIYYMPYSRMDRSEDGSPFTLKYVANFINSLKFDYVEVIEPHSDVTCAVLDRSHARMVNFSLLPKVMEDIGFHPAYDYVVFPDAGAGKRYGKILAPNILIGNKKRDFTNGKISGLELIGNIDSTYGKKAIIVDDLTSYGTTFVQTSKALKEKGIEQVYLLVAHTEPNAFKPHPATGDYLLEHIDRLYTTDSIINEEEISVVGGTLEEIKKGLDKLKVYNIEEVLKDA